MAEHFQHQQTKIIHRSVERLASSQSRQRVFEDFLTVTVCALAGGTMEQEYLEVAGRYAAGEKGSRGIDILAHMFADLVNAMEETGADILGDYFMGAITYGEHGQFYTPECITDMMSQMVGDGDGDVSDPCCGSGRMLLSAAKVNPRRQFFGQDLDLRCVKMTAINLALNGLRGRVAWGNSLALEERLVYLTGFNGRGFIREVRPAPSADIPQTLVTPAPEPRPKDVAGEQMSMFAA